MPDETVPVRPETQSSGLGDIIDRFALSYDALRELVDVGRSLLGQRAPSTLDEFGRVMLALRLCSEEVPRNTPSEIEAVFVKILEEPIQKRLAVLQKAKLPVKISDDGSKLEIDPARLDATRLIRESSVAKRAGLQEKLLYEGALMALTSQSEWLISQLIRVFFERFPSAAGDDEKFFSLQDLEYINSIKEARSVLIESRVEQQMRLSLDEWIKFFRQKTRLPFDFLEPRLPILREVFQRRNLVVHNDGVVNSYYLDRIDPALCEGVKPGDKIAVTSGYLKQAIDSMEPDFILIALELWRKWEKTEAERSTTLMGIAYDHMIAERWEIARRLFEFLMNDDTASEADRLRGQINYWQCMKWAGKYEAIRTEVEATDYSAKAPLFRLALYAVRDEYGEFFELLPHVLKNDDLKLEQLREWPLFRSVRQQPQYKSYAADAENLEQNQN